MHLANQSSRKLDKLSQGSSKLDSYPRVQWGNTLDKREATDSKGKIPKKSSRRVLISNPVNPRKQSKGEC